MEEVERRYWVSCSSIDPDQSGEDDKEKRRKMKDGETALLKVFEDNFDDGYLLKTCDINEAWRAADFANRIFKDVFGFDYECFASIVAQPVCPDCETLGRFSQFYCPTCGTELLPKEYLG